MKNKIQKYLTAFCFVLGTALVMSSCYKQDEFAAPVAPTRTTIATIENIVPKLNTRVLFGYTYDIFKTALFKTGLDAQLRDASKTYTVFVPDDFAFNQLPAPFNSATAINNLNSTIAADAANIAYLKKVIQNHIVEGSVLSSSFGTIKTGELPKSVKTISEGTAPLLVLKEAVGVEGKLDYVQPLVNGTQLVGKDNLCSNGVVHFVSMILLPETMYSYVAAERSAGVPVDSRYTRLKVAIDRFNDLKSYLSATSSSTTFFTPSTGAFAGSGFATDAAVTAADPVLLRRILDYHVLSEQVGRLPVLAGAAGTSVFYPTRVANRSINVSFVTITSTGLGLQGFADIFLDRSGLNPNAVNTGIRPGINFYGDYLLDTTGGLATVNGILYNADTRLLNPTP